MANNAAIEALKKIAKIRNIPLLGYIPEVAMLGSDIYTNTTPRNTREAIDYALDFADPGIAMNSLVFALPKLLSYDDNGKNRYGYSKEEMDSLLSAMTPTQLLEFAYTLPDNKQEVLNKIATYPDVLDSRSMTGDIFTKGYTDGDKPGFSLNWRDLRDNENIMQDITEINEGYYDPHTQGGLTTEEVEAKAEFDRRLQSEIENQPQASIMYSQRPWLFDKDFSVNSEQNTNVEWKQKAKDAARKAIELNKTPTSQLINNEEWMQGAQLADDKSNILNDVTVSAKNKMFNPSTITELPEFETPTVQPGNIIGEVQKTPDMPDTRRFIDKIKPAAIIATIRGKMNTRNLPKFETSGKLPTDFSNIFKYQALNEQPLGSVYDVDTQLPMTAKALNTRFGDDITKRLNTSTTAAQPAITKNKANDWIYKALQLAAPATATGIMAKRLRDLDDTMPVTKANIRTGAVRDMPKQNIFAKYAAPGQADSQVSNANRQFQQTQVEGMRAKEAAMNAMSRLKQEDAITNRFNQGEMFNAQMADRANQLKFMDASRRRDRLARDIQSSAIGGVRTALSQIAQKRMMTDASRQALINQYLSSGQVEKAKQLMEDWSYDAGLTDRFGRIV